MTERTVKVVREPQRYENWVRKQLRKFDQECQMLQRLKRSCLRKDHCICNLVVTSYLQDSQESG